MPGMKAAALREHVRDVFCAPRSPAPALGRPQVPTPDLGLARKALPQRDSIGTGPPLRAPPCCVSAWMVTGSLQDCAPAPRPASVPSTPGVPGPRPGQVTGHLVCQREK